MQAATGSTVRDRPTVLCLGLSEFAVSVQGTTKVGQDLGDVHWRKVELSEVAQDLLKVSGRIC
jgi:hypothetical protein